MEVLLEPLNVGPELDTITEESLEGSVFSRRSSGRGEDPTPQKAGNYSGSKEPSEHGEHSAVPDRNQAKDQLSCQKASDRDGEIKSESSMSVCRNADDSAADSGFPSQLPSENDDESVSERNSRKPDDQWSFSRFYAHCIYVQRDVFCVV